MSKLQRPFGASLDISTDRDKDELSGSGQGHPHRSVLQEKEWFFATRPNPFGQTFSSLLQTSDFVIANQK
jgi:hypothetical protein